MITVEITRNLFCIACGCVTNLAQYGFLFLVSVSWFRKKCRSFIEILEALFNEGSAHQCVVFAMVAWCLW